MACAIVDHGTCPKATGLILNADECGSWSRLCCAYVQGQGKFVKIWWTNSIQRPGVPCYSGTHTRSLFWLPPQARLSLGASAGAVDATPSSSGKPQTSERTSAARSWMNPGCATSAVTSERLRQQKRNRRQLISSTLQRLMGLPISKLSQRLGSKVSRRDGGSSSASQRSAASPPCCGLMTCRSFH